MSFFQGQDPLHGHVRAAEADRSTPRLRQQVPGPVGLQEVGPDEHAGRRRGQSPLHQHPLRSGQGQPQHLYQVSCCVKATSWGTWSTRGRENLNRKDAALQLRLRNEISLTD